MTNKFKSGLKIFDKNGAPLSPGDYCIFENSLLIRSLGTVVDAPCFQNFDLYIHPFNDAHSNTVVPVCSYEIKKVTEQEALILMMES